ncbi:RHS repeat-associated core domain-containing protein [Actinoplanes sp. NPDC024001]|uniref:RHS repeat domain-containing protein n=1 Tax=Actinoplanes sp. NPDC024001 TaxID=3154598 RepID=UPI0034012470
MFRRFAAPLAAVLLFTLPTGVPAAARAEPAAEKVDKDGAPVAAGKAWAQNRVRYAPAPKPEWPVKTAAVSAARGVTVRLLDRTSLPEQWRDRLVMSLSGTSPLSVNYSGFRYAAGGEWASRLRLWQVPECALTTPDVPSCRSVRLRSTNDVAKGVISTDAPVSARDSYVVLAAAESGGDGDFSATSLQASGTWTAGGSSGDFTWSYPMRTPPATGPQPDISLSYSAQSVDGRSEVTNNQPSMIGEGFEYSPGYLERRYIPCSDDMGPGGNTKKVSDLCWKSDNLTLSMNGRGGELIHEAGKGWHLRGEDGSRVERFTGAANGDNDGEYWRLTTTDGTQYFFGLNALPGHSDRTNSTLTAPVYGNHANEPCFKSGNFAGSYCGQAWRWQLDYVVDVRGNTMSYWYGKETNKYARNEVDADDTGYDRVGHLTRIDYGTFDRTAEAHGVTERSIAPRAQVVFENAMRCVANCGTEAAPVRENWKDTPWDQACNAAATACPQKYAPTFWSTKRLASVTTRVWDTTKETPAWQDVEKWTLTHTFAASADSTHTGLWLDRIDHAGLVGGTAAMPPVTFGAVSKANRVLTANGTTTNWLRISDIVTETGARTHVDYSAPECTATSPPTPHTNTKRCYPVLVPDPLDPNDKRLITEWWHKYRVEHVAQDDVQLAGGKQARSMHTWYEYVGAPAWRYADDDGVTRPERRTWSQWRGYATVKTRVGDSLAGPTTLTVTNFLRGLHGDRAAPAGGTRSVTVPASLGEETVHDEDQFAGRTREETTYNGVETKPVSRTVSVPWRSAPTASRTVNGVTAESRFTGVRAEYTATALGKDGARGWRVTRQVNELDPEYGTTTWTQDDGDVAVSGDEKCTANAYNRNATKNLTQTVRQTTVTALPCGQVPDGADDVISDERYSYDGADGPAVAPVYGSVTRTETLKDWAAGSGTVWQVAEQRTYQPDGRVVTSTDMKGNVTTTAYTPRVGGPATTETVTGPMPGWSTRRELNPYWGSATRTVDPNGRTTAEVAYDPLGRTAKVWRLGWPRAGHEDQPSDQYEYHFAPGRDGYPYIETRKLNSAGNTITSFQILDGLLRERQNQSPSAAGDGNRVVTDLIHDQYGRVTGTYGAHVEPGAASGTLWNEPEWSVPTVSRTVHDLASRVSAEVLLTGDGVENLVEEWRTTITQEGDLSTRTPQAGGVATTTVVDAEGRTVALRQHTTAAGVDGDYQETRYEYDRRGNRTKVVDAAGNEWLSQFDVRGRETRATDPDRGITSKTYNDAGEVVTTTDARGEVLWYGYDRIGRKTELRDDSATGQVRARWKYDTLYSGQTGFRGQLTETIRYEPAGSAHAYKWQVRQFDGRYQPTGANYVVPPTEDKLSGTYVYGFGYAAPTGAQLTMSMPAGPAGSGLVTEQLSTGYHAGTGMPVRLDTSLTGSAGTMATAEYTAFGELGGTVRSVAGSAAVEDATYRDEATRRITRITVTGVADRTYTYDPSGNITEITDTGDKQCFRYDRLARLTTAWTPRQTAACNAEPTTADLGGPAPYWQDWTYDTTGSRLTEVSHSAAGDIRRSYQKADPGPAHALATVTTTAPGRAATTQRYAYDAAGNTVCRPASAATNDCGTGTASQVLSWDAEGRVATVAAAGRTEQSSVHDAEGTRLIRRDSTGATLYLPGQEIRQEGTTVTGTRYYSLAGTAIAARAGGSMPANLTWLYADHQGTQQTAINAATRAVTTRRQTPFGSPRGTESAWPTEKGFVGGDNDPAGAVHLGAREYEPVDGRFLSVDPVFDPENPQQFNGYSYGGNNPVTNADPDGRCYGREEGDLCPGNTRGPWAAKDDAARERHFRPKTASKRGSGVRPPSCKGSWCRPWDDAQEQEMRRVLLRDLYSMLDAQRASDRCANDFAGYLCRIEENSQNGPAQKAWCVYAGPEACLLADLTGEIARHEAEKLRNLGVSKGQANAVLHGMWMALLTAGGVSVEDAMLLGAAHEVDVTVNTKARGDDWEGDQSKIDLHNNKVGAQLGASMRADRRNVQVLVMEAVREQILTSDGCGEPGCFYIYGEYPR